MSHQRLLGMAGTTLMVIGGLLAVAVAVIYMASSRAETNFVESVGATATAISIKLQAERNQLAPGQPEVPDSPGLIRDRQLNRDQELSDSTSTSSAQVPTTIIAEGPRSATKLNLGYELTQSDRAANESRASVHKSSTEPPSRTIATPNREISSSPLQFRGTPLGGGAKTVPMPLTPIQGALSKSSTSGAKLTASTPPTEMKALGSGQIDPVSTPVIEASRPSVPVPTIRATATMFKTTAEEIAPARADRQLLQSKALAGDFSVRQEDPSRSSTFSSTRLNREAEEQLKAVSAVPTPVPTARSVAHLAVIRRLTAPSIELDTLVIESAVEDGEWRVPKFVAGHLQGTAFPMEGSNIVLSAHFQSISSGNVFARVFELSPGDLVTLFTDIGDIKYSMVRSDTITWNDMRVVRPSDGEQLTLITCTGTWDPLRGDYAERYVVIARRPDDDPNVRRQ